MVEFFLVLLAMTLLDFLWTGYIRATAQGRVTHACGLASGIILTTGFVTVAYVDNPWNLIPAALGAAFGTYLAMRFL